MEGLHTIHLRPRKPPHPPQLAAIKYGWPCLSCSKASSRLSDVYVVGGTGDRSANHPAPTLLIIMDKAGQPARATPGRNALIDLLWTSRIQGCQSLPMVTLVALLCTWNINANLKRKFP